MEKIIKTIVTQLLSKLTKERITYTQKDLSDYGFPQFLVKRITFHLMRELRSEFDLPGEEWLNSKSDELLGEWAELQRTMKREIQLPAFLAETVVEKSVRECICMTIQPRKIIPQLLFEDRIEMDINQLTESSSAITVNRFLVWSMVRYMEKKNRESLNISDATRIIESIDDKIVQGYHPLNWLSLVKPIFELSGSTVHSDLFRRFFEHKGKNHLAKEFDLINDEIKESRFIEILSSPNSIHVKGYKDDQQTLFYDEHREKTVEVKKSTEDQIGNKVKISKDPTDSTPLFQSIRDEPLVESDEWVEDIGELDAKEGTEEYAAKPDEEVVGEHVLKTDEKVTEEKVLEPEDEVVDDQESQAEEKGAEEKVSGYDEDVTDEQTLESDDDVIGEQISEAEEVAEKQELEEDQGFDPEEDVKSDIQDEELRAPWEEEEEELYTFITHDENEDSNDSELKGLIEDEQAEGSNVDNEIFKMEETVSDAALLEINDDDEDLDSEKESADVKKEDNNTDDYEYPESSEETFDESAEDELDDEEESLYSMFKSDRDDLEGIPELETEEEFEDNETVDESDTEKLEVKSGMDSGLDEEALYNKFKSIQDRNESIQESDEDDVVDSKSIKESESAGLELDSESDDESEEDDSSLLNRFMFDDSDNKNSLANIESDGDKKVTTIYDELNLVRNNVEPETMDLFGSLDPPEIEVNTSQPDPVDNSPDFESDESETIRKFTEIEDPESEKDSNDTEVPMWRSFLERDENETKSIFQFDEESESNEEGLNVEGSDEKMDEDGFIEEPIYDFTQKEPDLDEKIGDLSNWMNDVRDKFIEDLFGDSEDAYEQALSDIMEFDDWKNASKYIEKEIFTRNRIDVYNEIAVDFTDRLHSYFIENKS